MSGASPTLTYLGGPSALLLVGGFRLLTDPTFDPAGTDYPTPLYVLHKSQGPAIEADALARPDAVLLSHDHHFDNLDHAGRRLLADAPLVLTTVAGAGRLGGSTVGLSPWQAHALSAPDGRALRITATPARHGPADADRGPVIGFVLETNARPGRPIYVSGDTVWYEGVAEVARRFECAAAVLFLGAARVRGVGPAHLTMTAEEAVLAARAFAGAMVVPLHFEGWAHFSEPKAAVERAFAAAGLSDRLRWPVPGIPISLGSG